MAMVSKTLSSRMEQTTVGKELGVELDLWWMLKGFCAGLVSVLALYLLGFESVDRYLLQVRPTWAGVFVALEALLTTWREPFNI